MILNAIDEETYKPKENVVFQGTFGIASENDDTFEYLYLGKGELFKNGAYQIEAVDGTVSAELRMVDGRFYYSADKPVKISLKNGKVKEYPAGYNLAVN